MRTLQKADLPQLRALRERGEFFWLDLHAPEPETFAQVADVLGLHELAVEDTLEFGQRPKAEAYGDQLLMVYFGASDDPDGVPSPVEVHLHVDRCFVLTVHREECRQFELMRRRLERRPAHSEQELIYRVIDALTDSVLDVLERTLTRAEEYESDVFDHPRARDRDTVVILKRGLGRLRRVLATQRQVFDRAVEQIQALHDGHDDLTAYYRDVADHLLRAVDDTESARDTFQGVLDTYTNEVQERLTIVATIFLPLTVLTGFFGQNFGWLVNNIGSTWAFWGLGVGGIVAAVLVTRAWLAHSGLYERRTARRPRVRSVLRPGRARQLERPAAAPPPSAEQTPSRELHGVHS